MWSSPDRCGYRRWAFDARGVLRVSRRHTSRAVETVHAIEESETWDTPDTSLDWVTEWAPTMVRIIEKVWKRTGARLYATHLNYALRDDLRSWLDVEAVTLAATYSPVWDDPDPEDRFAGWLYGALTEHARFHFSEVVGKSWTEKGRDAVAAFNKGLGSTEVLADLEREGVYVARYPLAAEDLFNRDPAVVYQRVEDLEHEADVAQRHRDIHGGYSTETSECMEPGCTARAIVRGRCNAHYRKYRERWGAEDGDPVCAVPGCGNVHQARGLCGFHYGKYRRGTLPADLQQYVQPLLADTKPTQCIEDGCTAEPYQAGRCRSHYDAHHATLRGPCTVEGCSRGVYLRGLCSPHYAQEGRRRRKEGRS